MPDRRRHRGPHPRDPEQFAVEQLARLRSATEDLCWLRSRGYAPKASLALVGDRHQLRERQRSALQRCSAGEEAVRSRRATRAEAAELRGRPLWIDGYNVLLTVEAALAGGIVLAARDGCYRDMASLQRHFRRVLQTRPALGLIGAHLESLGCQPVIWYLDRPVSNSGRLKQVMIEVAAEHGWPWTVELVPNPDTVLRSAEVVVATADSGILDAGPAWLNLARQVVESAVPSAWIVEL
ncbi:MAG: DUF434 domain-containing protein [Acidobacteriota bacterium]